MFRPLSAVPCAARSTLLPAARASVLAAALPAVWRAALLLIPLAVAIAIAPTAHAADMTAPDLAKARACLGCHQVDTKRVGPAWKSVASKYAGQPDAQAWLETSIRRGSANKWGKIPMPAQNHLTPAEAQQLAAWILTLK